MLGASAQTPQPATLTFDSARAWSHLLKQCEFGPRVPGSEAHLKCRDWIVEQMKPFCDNGRIEEFTHTWSVTGKKVTMWNIIGEQNWKDAKTRVVLLAHWDTRPFADQDPNPSNRTKPVLGANDGASGVAVLLELMRVLKGKHPDLGILYLMTDGEDLGPDLAEMFLGAKAFVKNLPTPKPDYGILLDMVGSKNVRIPMEMNSFGYAERLLRDFYDHAQKTPGAKAFPRVYGQYIEDDHIALNKGGIPTIDLIDFDHLDHWHTVTDTPENCSAESLRLVGTALESWFSQSPPYKFRGKDWRIRGFEPDGQGCKVKA